MLGLAADVRPVISGASWRSGLAPDLGADLLDTHSHSIGIAPASAHVLQKEGRHVAMDGRDPIVGAKSIQRPDDNRFLIVRRIKRSCKSALLLFFNQTDIKITSEEELSKQLKAVFAGQSVARLKWLHLAILNFLVGRRRAGIRAQNWFSKGVISTPNCTLFQLSVWTFARLMDPLRTLMKRPVKSKRPE